VLPPIDASEEEREEEREDSKEEREDSNEEEKEEEESALSPPDEEERLEAICEATEDTKDCAVWLDDSLLPLLLLLLPSTEARRADVDSSPL
jgi:hypothetical protein